MLQVAALVVVTYGLVHNADAARILGVFAHPTRSNSLFVHVVMSTLAETGHNVTVYSPYKPPSNCGFRHVLVETEYHKSSASIVKLPYKDFLEIFASSGFACRILRSMSQPKCDSFLAHPLVKELLFSNESYDLVVTGGTFGEQSLLVFGHKFNAPTISLIPMNTWSAVDYMAGNDMSMAFAPEYFAFPFTDKMNLFERTLNVLSATTNLLINHWHDIPGHDAILQRHASSLSPPPVYQMVRDIALTFVNVHPTVGYPKPLPPNIVFIGGIHIVPDYAPLSQDMQGLMDNAHEGVVFCSLGSIVPIDSMPQHLVQAFLNAFAKLPHKVIWKISKNNLPKLPENVLVASWLPQQRILEHPNLKLFFTHGGQGSQLEVLRAGVPVIGLPFITDQPYNVRMFESLGVGVGLQLDTLSEETITSALETVLNNKSYAENARRVARVYADRPMEPKDLVVYWTNYILKHGGKHLRTQAAMMPFYQRYLIDVAIVLLLAIGLCIGIIGIILAISIKLVRYIYQLMYCWSKVLEFKYKIM